MNKQALFVVVILILTLTGCAHAQANAALKPVNAAAWPTPRLAAAEPLPTPFPKISLADVATPVSSPTPRPVSAAAEPVAAAALLSGVTPPTPARIEEAKDESRQTELTIENSKLVLQLSSGGDIVTITPNGSGLRRLTTGIDPALSPDGQTVAFTRWQGDNGSLWVINVDGSNERQILGFTKQPKGPDWSPDGSRLVINFQHEGRLEAKTICHDLSEGDPPQPPANAYGYLDENDKPKVKIDRKSDTEVDVDFCYTLPPDPHWGLRVVSLADGTFEDLDGGAYAFRPAWDPAQPWRVVSDGGHGLLAVDVTRHNPHKLTQNVNDGAPVFSPDGRFIALAAGQGSQGHNIFRMNSDGSGRIRLTNTPLWAAVQPGGQQAWHNVAPAWSPDGARIAFLTNRTGRWEVWGMNPDGSNPHPLFSEAVNDQLPIAYNFVDERVISWR